MHIRVYTQVAGAFVLILALILPGCGGGDDGSGGQASVGEVNAACSTINKGTVAKLKKSGRTAEANGVYGSEKEEIQLEVTTWVPLLIAAARSEIEAIESLDVPDGDQEQVDEIRSAYRAWIGKAQDAPLKVIVANDVYSEGRQLATKYGLKKCGVDPFDIWFGGAAA